MLMWIRASKRKRDPVGQETLGFLRRVVADELKNQAHGEQQENPNLLGILPDELKPRSAEVFAQAVVCGVAGVRCHWRFVCQANSTPSAGANDLHDDADLPNTRWLEYACSAASVAPAPRGAAGG